MQLVDQRTRVMRVAAPIERDDALYIGRPYLEQPNTRLSIAYLLRSASPSLEHLACVGTSVSSVTRLSCIKDPIPEIGLAQLMRYIRSLPAAGDWTAARPCSKSAIRSASASRPIESRIRLSMMPAAHRASAPMLEWVMVDGCATRLSTPPSDSASVKTSTASTKRRTASTPPA